MNWVSQSREPEYVVHVIGFPLEKRMVETLLFRRMNLKLFVLMIPALLFFFVFVIYSVFRALYTSFFEDDGLNPPTWVGLSNWATILRSPTIYHSLWLTVEVMILCWLVQTPFSLVLGLFLSRERRFTNVLSVFYFTPLLFSSAALGIAWSYILNPNFGLLAAILTKVFGVTTVPDLLGNAKVVIFTLVGVISWQFIPFHTLLYQSGARAIPAVLYEAAELDGVNAWTRLWHITIPQMKNTIVTSSVLILTGSLTYFDIIFVLTNGGPGDASNVIALEMYKTAFQQYQFGLGSAVAIIMTLFGLLLSLVLVKVTGFSRMESQMEGGV